MRFEDSNRRWMLGALVTALFGPPLSSASTDYAALTVGRDRAPCGSGQFIYSGYIEDHLGSYSPTGLTGDTRVRSIYEVSGCGLKSFVTISGFTQDPGSHWLVSITCNGVKQTGVAAVYFNYGNGTASWQWNQPLGLKAQNTDANVGCSLVHQ